MERKDDYHKMQHININKPVVGLSFEQQTKNEIKMLKDRIAKLEKDIEKLLEKKT